MRLHMHIGMQDSSAPIMTQGNRAVFSGFRRHIPFEIKGIRRNWRDILGARTIQKQRHFETPFHFAPGDLFQPQRNFYAGTQEIFNWKNCPDDSSTDPAHSYLPHTQTNKGS